MKSALQTFVGTTAEWQSENPVLPEGALAVEVRTDGKRSMKVGDGASRWDALNPVVVEALAPIFNANANSVNLNLPAASRGQGLAVLVSTDFVNAPELGWGVCLNLDLFGFNSYTRQLYFPLGNNNIYTRKSESGNFSPWVNLMANSSRYNVSFKVSLNNDYITFGIPPTSTPYFANEVSGSNTFANVTVANFVAAMKTYFPSLNTANKTVTIGGASGPWKGAYIHHVSLMMVDPTTLRLYLNTSNSADTFELPNGANPPQFAVNVSMVN